MEKQLTLVKGFLIDGTKFAIVEDDTRRIVVALHGDAVMQQPVEEEGLAAYPELGAVDCFSFNGKPCYTSQGVIGSMERLMPTHKIYVTPIQRAPRVRTPVSEELPIAPPQPTPPTRTRYRSL